MCLIIIQTISLIIDFIIGIISSETEKDISFVYPIAFAYINRIYQFCYSRFYFGFFSHRPHYPTSLHGNVYIDKRQCNNSGSNGSQYHPIDNLGFCGVLIDVCFNTVLYPFVW